jgi:hypothetical protein
MLLEASARERVYNKPRNVPTLISGADIAVAASAGRQQFEAETSDHVQYAL